MVDFASTASEIEDEPEDYYTDEEDGAESEE